MTNEQALEFGMLWLDMNDDAKDTETYQFVKLAIELIKFKLSEKTAYWEKHDTGHSIYYDCSLCHCVAPYTETADSWLWKFSKYCPDCGTRMLREKGIETKAIIKEETDYLQRLRNSRKNLLDYIKAEQIRSNSLLGESFQVALKLLDEEIESTAKLRELVQV